MSNIIEQVQNVAKKMIQDEVDLNARNRFNETLSKVGLSKDKISEMNSMLDNLDRQMAHESYKKYYANNWHITV